MAEPAEDLRELFAELGVPGAGDWVFKRSLVRDPRPPDAPPRELVNVIPPDEAPTRDIGIPEAEGVVAMPSELGNRVSLRELFERLRAAGRARTRS